jgi:hypothetical protein
MSRIFSSQMSKDFHAAHTMSDNATTFAPLPLADVLDAINGLVAVVIFNHRAENGF